MPVDPNEPTEPREEELIHDLICSQGADPDVY